jgi:hypothetical protein
VTTLGPRQVYRRLFRRRRELPGRSNAALHPVALGPAAVDPVDPGIEPVERFREYLARRSGAGVPTEFWWRDDDLADDCEGFRHLARVARSTGICPLVAAIPTRLQPGIGGVVAGLSEITVCQHGYAHVTHEPAGAPKSEFGHARTEAGVRADIADGRRIMKENFGPHHAAVFVPPWNRFAPCYADILVEERFSGFSSSSGPLALPGRPNLRCVDIDLSVLDWTDPPSIREPAVLLAKLNEILMAAGLEPRAPIGILTHHRAMVAAAWQTLEEVFALISTGSGARWRHPRELFAPDPAVLPNAQQSTPT